MINKEINGLRNKCVSMWEWVSEQKDGTRKSAYFIKHPTYNVPEENCYACAAGSLIGGADADCKFCPIDWGKSGGCCDSASPYEVWDLKKTRDNAIKFLEYIEANWELLPEE